MGLCTKIIQLPSDKVKAFLKLDSAIGPSTIPKTIGTGGNPNLFIKYATTPKINIIYTSKTEFAMANAPAQHIIISSAVKSCCGMCVILTKTGIKYRPWKYITI